jgi:hypothetical protein
MHRDNFLICCAYPSTFPPVVPYLWQRASILHNRISSYSLGSIQMFTLATTFEFSKSSSFLHCRFISRTGTGEIKSPPSFMPVEGIHTTGCCSVLRRDRLRHCYHHLMRTPRVGFWSGVYMQYVILGRLQILILRLKQALHSMLTEAREAKPQNVACFRGEGHMWCSHAAVSDMVFHPCMKVRVVNLTHLVLPSYNWKHGTDVVCEELAVKIRISGTVKEYYTCNRWRTHVLEHWWYS